MTALPPAGNFTDPGTKESGFKTAVTNFISWATGLFGTAGDVASTRTALGLGDAATKNQGPGNGLDADTVDGSHASAFATAANLTTTNNNLTNHTGNVSNPHATTAAQVGALASVDGVSNPGGNIDLVAGTNITLTPNNTAKTITIAAASGGGGDVTNGANLGSGGSGVFISKSGTVLQFKTIKAGSGITLVDDGQNITISLTPAGGGGDSP